MASFFLAEMFFLSATQLFCLFRPCFYPWAMAADTHIFPFYTRPETDAVAVDGLASDILVLRGVAMQKRRLDTTVPLFLGSRKIEGEIFYWHPIAQKTDFIEKGILMVKEGLGFARKGTKHRGPLAAFRDNRTVQ